VAQDDADQPRAGKAEFPERREGEADEAQFDGFTLAIITAIEQRDPATAGHSFRVEKLTTSLAHAVNKIADGKYRDVRFTDDQLKELRYACLLLDFGKIAVREHILVKEKKLFPFQFELIQSRFESIVWSVRAKLATEKLEAMRSENGSAQVLDEIDRRLREEIGRLRRWLDAIVQANEPSMLAEDTASVLEHISQQTYYDTSGKTHPMLVPEEFRLLSIRRGTLDEQERLEMESHVTLSFSFLSRIPWPPSLRGIPEIVYAHHEKLDGSGYPRGLVGDQIPLQTKMITIADIYDALTAPDRPYKRAVPVDQALHILRSEAEHGKLDRDLLDVFITKHIYELTTRR
jgi:response regulator RpfG family c-di-GMP phosphodiesterase